VAVCNWVQLVFLWLHDHHRLQDNCGFILLQSENHNAILIGSCCAPPSPGQLRLHSFFKSENYHNIAGDLDTIFSWATLAVLFSNVTAQLATAFSRATVASFFSFVTGQLDTTFSRATVASFFSSAFVFEIYPVKKG
jgi:hypothetical protein